MIAEHHYQDKSVWVVIQIYLHQLLHTQALLARARRGPVFDERVIINPSTLKEISEILGLLNADLEKMKLRVSTRKLTAVRKTLDRLVENPPEENMVKIEAILLGIAMDELQSTIEYELEVSLMYYFEAKERELLRKQGQRFGSKAWNKFPEAQDDMSQAVRCMGFSCWTASVCHMVRAVECVLHVVSDKLGVTVQRNWNWGTVTDKMQKKVDAMPRGKEREYWNDVILQFVCIKNCTRLKSMHVRPGYTFSEEDAEKMFQAVKGFLQSLADAIS